MILLALGHLAQDLARRAAREGRPVGGRDAGAAARADRFGAGRRGRGPVHLQPHRGLRRLARSRPRRGRRRRRPRRAHRHRPRRARLRPLPAARRPRRRAALPGRRRASTPWSWARARSRARCAPPGGSPPRRAPRARSSTGSSARPSRSASGCARRRGSAPARRRSRPRPSTSPQQVVGDLPEPQGARPRRGPDGRGDGARPRAATASATWWSSSRTVAGARALAGRVRGARRAGFDGSPRSWRAPTS